jgi:hypothetical protein
MFASSSKAIGAIQLLSRAVPYAGLPGAFRMLNDSLSDA